MGPDFVEECNDLRQEIKKIGDQVFALIDRTDAIPKQQKSMDLATYQALKKEMAANVDLAYRHLEDARMRIGKVLQARDGGVSVYDAPKPTPPPTDEGEV